MKPVAIVLAALLLCLGAPAISSAQFGPNAPAPLLEEQPDTVPFDEDEGLSTLQLVLIFGGAAVVVGLIAGAIMRDARGKAPAKRSGSGSRSGPTATPETPTKSSAAKAAREREREKARKRNKAKAARNQRKHNRPR